MLASSPPSSPLSVLSKSPSLPPVEMDLDASKRYPSPSSTTPPSGSASPLKLPDATEEICVRTDGPPPPKRRKIAPPKPRTTKYVNLENPEPEDEAHIDRLLATLRKKKKIVVIAGAGISVSAGSRFRLVDS
jgi:NAD-dependent histone deacetylase SIR2